MSAQNESRKRPAPGADPLNYPQQMSQSNSSYNDSLGPQLSDDQFLQWGQIAQSQNPYSDPSHYNSIPIQPSFNDPVATPSNQIARRPMNQIATRPTMNNAPWLPDSGSAPPTMNGGWEDNVDELEQKAQVAKKDAQAKRKAIPPFVQKLRSFLDHGQNSDLIRWTDDGKSFVVLDEDEFAKKLIPELFKHNNYASFVRQLNMYGFHKKVGLSDNSMRASERKSKSPSEYSNPYFRQGHPDLMWLIQKPKNMTSNSKGKGRTKSEGENIDDNEDVAEEIQAHPETMPRPRLTLGEPDSNMTLQTMQSVQRELAAIRLQQAQISKVLASIKREHEQLYSQAATFQDQHTRHENSINAILTFLATVYNRSLSGQDNTPNFAGLFGNNLPQNAQSSGVVDVGDYNFDQFSGMGDRPIRRPPLLLTDGQTRAETLSPATANSPQFRQGRRVSQMPQQSTSPTVRVEEVQDFDDVPQPQPRVNARPQRSAQGNGQQQRDMMSMIQNANARNPSPTTPVADFANVLNDLEHSRGNTPLTSTQRDKVLQMINNSANQSGDSALVNSTPPAGPTNFDHRLESTKADLDALAKMQARQDQSVEKLTNLLQPLSPSGSIPGLGDGQNFPPPPGMDIDDFLGNQDFFADLPNDSNPFDFNNTDSANGNSFNWDNNNDDELFPNVNSNDNHDFFGAEGRYSNDNKSNQRSNFGTGLVRRGDGDDGLGVGKRVESIASSEAGTPNNSGISGNAALAGDPDEDTQAGNSTRNKFRKLNVSDDHAGGEASVKRRRMS